MIPQKRARDKWRFAAVAAARDLCYTVYKEVGEVCDRNEALKILTEIYKECSNIVPVTDAYLYGSYARGEQTDGSDVDIMLLSSLSEEELHDKRKQFVHISSELSLAHDVTVSLSVRSKERFMPELLPFHANVLRDGIRYKKGVYE
ncbi:MAG: nucleotidyltransferase domain-containing protein [Clostridiales bacterium]|nr:nucleotidyltransferase domain-containing protein [Clostridiales bacterium]